MKENKLIQESEMNSKESTTGSYFPKINNNLSGSFLSLSTNATYNLDYKHPIVEGETVTREFLTDTKNEYGEVRTVIETGTKGYLIREVIIDKKVLDKLKENSVYDSVIRKIIRNIEFFLSTDFESYQIRVYLDNKYSFNGNIFIRIALNNKTYGRMMDLWDSIHDIIFNNVDSIETKKEKDFLKGYIFAEIRSL